MIQRILAITILSVGVLGAQDALLTKARKSFQAVPEKAPAISGNPSNAEKIELGKMLFFDPRLSSSWLISCNTCHNVGMSGVDALETAVGHGWKKGGRNSPTVFNAVFNNAQFWDGRAKDLREQAKGPVQAAIEMNSTPARSLRTLKSIPEYVARFRAAFAGEADPVTFENMAKAIEVFEATLLTPHARFDQYLGGKSDALNAAEKQGLEVFLTKGCVACHAGVNMGGTGYYPFGVVERPGAEILPAGDLGRFQVTNTASDQYVFKSPSLRNIELTAPYFHSGKVWDLREAVSVMGSAQLGIKLSGGDVDAIVAFLKTLTGDQPRVQLPVLPGHTKDTPLPNTSVNQ